jgi:autotransporter-associated beta strand protein
MKPNQTTPNRLAILAAAVVAVLLMALAPQSAQACNMTFLGGGGSFTYYWKDTITSSTTTAYAGDQLVFSQEVYPNAVGNSAGVGINTGSWNTYAMSYLQADGNNGVWQYQNAGTPTRFAAGSYQYYFYGSASDSCTIYNNNGGANYTLTVTALVSPSGQTATAASSTNVSISLVWAQGVSGGSTKNTVIFRSTNSTAPTLTQNTAYALNATGGSGATAATCICATTNGTSFTDNTGLTAGTTYYYYFFAENFSYYSAAVSASATATRPTTVTWNGGGADNNLLTDTNWVGNLAPASGISTFLTFAGSTRPNPYNNFPAGSTFSNIFFNGITVPFTLGGSNFNIQQKIENDNSSLVTINNSITWAASSGPTSGEINAVGGNLDFTNGTLTVNGSSIAGIKMWNAAGETNIFDGTVSASGKWFGLTQNPAGAATINGAFTSGDFYLMNGGILNLSGSGSFSTSGLRLGGDYGNTGNQDLTKGGIFNLTSPTGGQTYAGIINSVAGNTSGSLVIYSANTSGTNIINGASYLDSGLIVSNAAGGTLLANASTAFDVKAQQLTLTPYGTILVQGILTSSTSSSTVPGGTLLMNGPGTLILSNTANAYSGTSGADLNANSTLITGGGILGIYGDGSLGVVPNGPYNNIQFTGSGTLQDTVNNVSLNVNRSISVAAASTATLDSNTNTFAVPGIISGSGAVAKAGSGTLTLSGANTYTGATTISAGTLTIGGAGQLGSSGNYSAAITNNSAFNYNSSAAQTLSGIISGTGSLTENGAGAITLSGANTFTGNMTVKAGAVSVSNPTGLGVGTVVVGSTSGSANASLLAAGGNNTFTNLITVQSGNSGVLVIGNQSGANNSYVFSGNVSLNNALTLLAASTGTVKLSGNITGSSLITVTNDGALVSTSQYVDLTGANSGFTGNVAVNGGMLRPRP